MEEAEHILEVLEATKEGIRDFDAIRLRELSNQTIHSASIYQDSGSITLAVIIYTLSKLIERSDYKKIKSWSAFTKKLNSYFDLAILALREDKHEKYEAYLQNIGKSLSGVSPNLKSYIQDVLRKSSISKASKIYEHGISMGQTAKLLGITQWELSEYTGQKSIPDIEYNISLDVKKRAKMALEFFS